MKQVLLVFLLAMATCSVAMAQSKADRRVAYTLRNMHLNKQTEAQLEPLLRQYLKEKKTATKAYDDLKDKHKAAIKAGTLTDSQASQLLAAKFVADSAEAVVKRKYVPVFSRVLKPKQVYYVFDYIGDKMSKIDGKSKDDD